MDSLLRLEWQILALICSTSTCSRENRRNCIMSVCFIQSRKYFIENTLETVLSTIHIPVCNAVSKLLWWMANMWLSASKISIQNSCSLFMNMIPRNQSLAISLRLNSIIWPRNSKTNWLQIATSLHRKLVQQVNSTIIWQPWKKKP